MSNFILGNFEQYITPTQYYSGSTKYASGFSPLPAGYFQSTAISAVPVRCGPPSGSQASYGLFDIGTATIRLFKGAIPTVAEIDAANTAGAGSLRTADLLLTEQSTGTSNTSTVNSTGRASWVWTAAAANATGVATWFALQLNPGMSGISYPLPVPFIVGTVGTTGTPDLLLADANITQGVIYTLPTLSIKMTPNVAEF